MKKKLLVVILLCQLITIYALEDTIRVGFHTFPPLVFIDENNEADGFFIEILEYIAEKEGWNLEYIHGSWEESLERLRKHEIDLLGSIAFSSERDMHLDYTDEFLFLDWGQIFIPPESNIHTILDLEGKEVAALRSDIYTEGFNNVLKQFGISVKLLEVEEYTEVFEAVQSGLVDAGITTNVYGAILENSYKVKKSDIVFNPVKLRFAVPQNEHKLLIETLDEYFKRLKLDKNSIYYSSYNEWMNFAESSNKIPQILLFALYGAIFLTIILVLFIILLRHQVALKTGNLHKNEKKLLESEKRLRLEKEQLPLAYVEWDLDHKIVGWNPAAERIFGYPKEAAIGSELDLIIPSDSIAEVRLLFNRIIHSEESIKNTNINKTMDGRIITCEWYNKYLLDADGVPIGIVAIGNDITDKTVLEEKANEANRVKDSFLSNISHELRTPLNGAIGMIELLKDMEQTEESAYYLDLAAQSVDRLFSIVKNLLDFVQIDSGSLGLIVESFNVDMMIKHSISVFSNQIKEKKLSIAFSNQNNKNEFAGDKARIAQIIVSLLSNAVKFSTTGIITISYSIDPDLKISISDEGIGIPEGQIDDIFKILEQLEDPYTKKYEGIGIGLAIVKNLVALMGGSITVNSEPGKGTAFYITIPASEIVRKQADVEAIQDQKLALSPEEFTILIAEDEGINRIIIREILKKNNFPVIEAKNGKEVLNLVETHSPGLILMDIGMPVLNGLDATIELRKMERFIKTPILALTAYTGKDDISRFLSG